MKQEYKELLLKDLCARLPYGVKVLADINKTFDGGIISEVVCINLRKEWVELENVITPYHYDEVKPYLRPISSMTTEEYKEMQMVLGRGEFAVLMNKTSGLELWLESFDTDPTIWFDSLVDVQDWLNKKMFAYRTINGYDMFELGLAIPAPEGMYK